MEEAPVETAVLLEEPYTVLLHGWLKLSVYQGDITEERVDAIVNAANSYLHHSGGLAKVICDKGGR